MRREPTEAERKLWGALRNRRLGGFKFYRQVPIGPYIVDFINHEFGVVVEVDGVTHGEDHAVRNDVKRTSYLNSLGLVVHRVNNLEVFQQTESILGGILAVIETRVRQANLIRPFRAPSPKEKGEV